MPKDVCKRQKQEQASQTYRNAVSKAFLGVRSPSMEIFQDLAGTSLGQHPCLGSPLTAWTMLEPSEGPFHLNSSAVLFVQGLKKYPSIGENSLIAEDTFYQQSFIFSISLFVCDKELKLVALFLCVVQQLKC